MRYKLGAIEIRSENAAKPMVQASTKLSEYLRNLSSIRHALDYGCGKLRYSPLLTVAETVTLVDSEIQLSRKQKIEGHLTTIREYSKKWKNARVLSVAEFATDRSKYDFILCANVLSAIPVVSVRNETLRRLANALNYRGKCLFVSQYRNSEFSKIARSTNIMRHLDGWIMVSNRGAYYYGLLDKKKLRFLVQRFGFSVLQSWTCGESAYVLTTRA